MTDWSNPALQTIEPGESAVFTLNPVPCTRGFVRNRAGSGSFVLSGWVPNRYASCCCCRKRNDSAIYMVDFGANIAIPTGGTVEPISVAFSLDGTTLPETIMTVTPAAVEEFSNVSRAANVEVWKNCCQTFSIRNIGVQAILMQNANLIFNRPDLAMTR